jgi:hypothetical protein
MTIQDTLTRRFIDTLTSTAEGRAHVLNLASEAEGTDELRMFDALLAQVDDPSLARVVRRHKDDELRHQRLFAEARDRTGVATGKPPPELLILERIDAKLGGFLHRPVTGPEDIARFYLILQVVEERAITQFELLEPAFRRFDVQAADTIREIRGDEDNHLLYCKAIAKRYYPDDAAREAELDRLRELEAEAFHENGQASMKYALEHGMVKGVFERIFWTAMGKVAHRAAGKPYTRFHRDSQTAPAQPLPAAA